MKTGKCALITGGTMGIGYELARLFAKDGYNLILIARHEQDLDKVATKLGTEFGVDIMTFAKDLFDVKNAFDVHHLVKAANVNIDVLVNNARHGQYGEFADTDINKYLEIINLNISSLVVLTKLFVEDMLAAGEGKILNVSSIAAKSPGPWHSVYHGTKAFVQSFSEAIRQELKDKNITVTALLPGATDTDFFRKADMEESKVVQEEKLADPAEVAKDGYDALMEGKDMVVSGLKNKLNVALGKLKSDEANAEKMGKQQEPVHEK